MDDEILSLLLNRRESALDEILRQYGKLLKGLARRILPTAEDAEECVNDALLDVWNTIPPQKPASIASYAAMLTRRRAVDRIRYMTAKKRSGGTYSVALDELYDCIPGGAVFDEDADVLRETLNSFLAELPAEDRLIFVGRYFAFEPIETLASRHKTSKNAISIRLTRMRKRLKESLEAREVFV